MIDEARAKAEFNEALDQTETDQGGEDIVKILNKDPYEAFNEDLTSHHGAEKRGVRLRMPECAHYFSAKFKGNKGQMNTELEKLLKLHN